MARYNFEAVLLVEARGRATTNQCKLLGLRGNRYDGNYSIVVANSLVH